MVIELSPSISNFDWKEFCNAHDISFLGVFGSRARGDSKPDSDLDLLVIFKKKKTLIDLVLIEQNLSEKFDLSVDLNTENGLSPYFKEDILDAVVTLYDER